MSETLYLLLDQNVQVHSPHVTLQDIARLSCSDSKTLNRVRVMPVTVLDEKKPGRYVMSVTELLTLIQKKEPGLNITPIGEPTFLITLQKEPAGSRLLRWGKIFFICLAVFFGSAFSIMTFNSDVDIRALFSQIYTQVTGQTSSGFTVLEISYSVGIGLGLIFFFNHFGKMKLSDDPTPMQVQMRTYEDDVNKTLLEDAGRKGSIREE